MAAAQDVQVEVIHGLAAVGLAVDDKPGALFAAAKFFGNFLCLKQKPPQEDSVGGFQFHYVPDMPFGNHQKMNRRLGIHVVEGQEFVVLENLFGRDLPLYDFTENAVAHGFSLS